MLANYALLQFLELCPENVWLVLAIFILAEIDGICVLGAFFRLIYCHFKFVFRLLYQFFNDEQRAVSVVV